MERGQEVGAVMERGSERRGTGSTRGWGLRAEGGKRLCPQGLGPPPLVDSGKCMGEGGAVKRERKKRCCGFTLCWNPGF